MNRNNVPEDPNEMFNDMKEISIEDMLDLPAEIIEQNKEQSMALMMQTKRVMQDLVYYREFMMMYTCAMKEIRTKFDVLNTEFNVRYQRNPINFIKTRLKRSVSIIDKLDKKDLDFTLDNIEKHVKDVAGVRVICSYVDDIYIIADTFLQQDDIELVERKDYIQNPKESGYRSLHLIVRVPVFFANQTRKMTVEVQLRTIAMDFWASLEHQLKYKQNVENEAEIIERLQDCADVIARTDQEMLEIRREIDEHKSIPSDDEILFEKLKKIDVAIE